jgi:hypothetical protein
MRKYISTLALTVSLVSGASFATSQSNVVAGKCSQNTQIMTIIENASVRKDPTAKANYCQYAYRYICNYYGYCAYEYVWMCY